VDCRSLVEGLQSAATCVAVAELRAHVAQHGVVCAYGTIHEGGATLLECLPDVLAARRLARANVSRAVGEQNDIAREERGMGAAQVQQHAIVAGNRHDSDVRYPWSVAWRPGSFIFHAEGSVAQESREQSGQSNPKYAWIDAKIESKRHLAPCRLLPLVNPRHTSMFEFSQIRCFVAVAEELHFGRAAARLHMTQPPLSRQIQLLEHQIGAQLLERSSRSVRLTRAGRAFLPEARTILRMAESASLAARRVSQGESGSIAIGFTASSGYRFLPDLMIMCRTHLPNVELMLKELVTMEQVDALASGRLDLALLRPHAATADFEMRCVAREPLVVALPENHPLATGRLPRLTDFDHSPVVMYSPVEARYFHDLVARTFSRVGVHPEYTQYVSQIHSILALVRAGFGAALVPEAAGSLRFEGVVIRPVQKMRPARPVELFMAWRRGNDNPALASLLEKYREHRRLGAVQ
jgi:DNA-binding transcriptional LysR family regulator